jgi:hypothetical protein
MPDLIKIPSAVLELLRADRRRDKLARFIDAFWKFLCDRVGLNICCGPHFWYLCSTGNAVQVLTKWKQKKITSLWLIKYHHE